MDKEQKMERLPPTKQHEALQGLLAPLSPTVEEVPEMEQALAACLQRIALREEHTREAEQQANRQQEQAVQPAPASWMVWATGWAGGRQTWAWLSAVAVVALFLLPQMSTSWKAAPLRIPKGTQISLWYTGARLAYRAKVKAKDGELLQPGDQIQFTYRIPKKMYVVLASLNPKGDVSVYAPLESVTSLPLQAPQGQLEQLELDESTGRERLFALVSSKPFAVSAAKRALKQAFRREQSMLAIRQVPGPWSVAWTLWFAKHTHDVVPKSQKKAIRP